MDTSIDPRRGETEALFARAKLGDPQAWEQLVSMCSPKLNRVVRRRLDRPLRSLYDTMDVANEVFASLAIKCSKFEFESFDKLMSFLAHSAEQKIVNEHRRRHAQEARY